MAALCTGNYGLSQNCTDDSKEYFFVKLTDSAYRAVEDYQKNQNRYNARATIQIYENGGVLSFPNSNGQITQQFRFSIDEIEGSLECIKQSENNLDVLGTLPYKMRIHANEDVYETTRHRMTVAEETQKKKSTVEIKPNQTAIGRGAKVKLKPTSNRITNIPSKRDFIVNSTSSVTNASSNVLSSSASSLPPSGSNSISSSSSQISSNNNNNNNSVAPQHLNKTNSLPNVSNTKLQTNNVATNNISTNNAPSKYLQNSYSNLSSNNSIPTGASSLSSALSSAAGSGTSGVGNGYFNNNTDNGRSGSMSSLGINSLNIGAGSRKNNVILGNNNRTAKANNRHLPDITKRKIKERLIHLLALKPFKKLELYERLKNEGIREREKNLISNILKEISTIRDNTYNLKRQIWNDVNEDWPFYTEQELQLLKRRKPQNLTPPVSSDGGSSTSGQSPTSTHNGSPPPAVKRPSLDRERYFEEPTAKKQRISHFRKDEINSSNLSGNKYVQQDVDENSISLSYSVLNSEAAQRISPRDYESNDYIANNNVDNFVQSTEKRSESLNNINNQKLMNPFSSNNNNNTKNTGNSRQKSPTSYNNNLKNKSDNGGNSNLSNNNIISITNISNNTNNNNNGNSNKYVKGTMQSSERRQTSNINLDLPLSDVSRLSPDANGEQERDSAINCNDIGRVAEKSNNNNNVTTSDEPEIAYDFSRFTKIASIEQRRQYKTEFEKDYEEYKKLRTQIESVGDRFKQLAQQLNNAKNNDANYRTIKKQIVFEYEKIRRHQDHQRSKARFDYLHAKLSHIKSLVGEFDKTLTSSETTMASSGELTNQNRTLQLSSCDDKSSSNDITGFHSPNEITAPSLSLNYQNSIKHKSHSVKKSNY